MTQPDREHHLANHVAIESVEVQLTVLASDKGVGPYVTDVVNLGQLRTTIAISDPANLDGPQEVLAQVFLSAIRMGLDSVKLFDARSERFAIELNALTEKMAATKAKREAQPDAQPD